MKLNSRRRQNNYIARSVLRYRMCFWKPTKGTREVMFFFFFLSISRLKTHWKKQFDNYHTTARVSAEVVTDTRASKTKRRKTWVYYLNALDKLQKIRVKNSRSIVFFLFCQTRTRQYMGIIIMKKNKYIYYFGRVCRYGRDFLPPTGRQQQYHYCWL